MSRRRLDLGRLAFADGADRAASGRAIFGPNSPEMGLHDLPRDRKSEAGILSETIVGAVGVKTLENALQRVRRDARTVVLDLEDDAIGGALASPPASRLAAEVEFGPRRPAVRTNRHCRSDW